MDFSIVAHPLQSSLSPKQSRTYAGNGHWIQFSSYWPSHFLIPLALFIALLIRSVSTGPVLFRQERVGYLGRRFMCFKFRTMFVDADATIHQGHLHHLMNSNTPMMKMDSRGDPRIIPFGLFLRASGWMSCPN